MPQAVNQHFVGAVLRLCQLTGQYAHGMVFAVEAWTHSEVTVGSEKAEKRCGWMPEVYRLLGELKCTQSLRETRRDWKPSDEKKFRDEAWAEGLRLIAQGVLSSRVAGSVSLELRALLSLHEALGATKNVKALKPQPWMKELDPTIYNAKVALGRISTLYEQMGASGPQQPFRVPLCARAHS